MKIQIASDMHLEGRIDNMPTEDDFVADESRDLLILAGDIGVNMQASKFVIGQTKISPVIYVPGNHEYYTSLDREEVDFTWRNLAATQSHQHELHYLTGQDVVIGVHLSLIHI